MTDLDNDPGKCYLIMLCNEMEINAIKWPVDFL